MLQNMRYLVFWGSTYSPFSPNKIYTFILLCLKSHCFSFPEYFLFQPLFLFKNTQMVVFCPKRQIYIFILHALITLNRPEAFLIQKCIQHKYAYISLYIKSASSITSSMTTRQSYWISV